MSDFLLNAILMALLLLVSIGIQQQRNLFAAIMLTGVFSLLCATVFVTLDAVDVAFTEAAVGAGIATVLFLSVLAQLGGEQRERQQTPRYRKLMALATCLGSAAILSYAALDAPHFGDPQAPAQQHLAPRYLHQSAEEIGLPNVVTSVLAAYRSYDTMGETLVIFTAGIAVFGLLGNTRKRQRDKQRRSQTHDRDIVLSVFAQVMVPLILLFALYVQFHGDFGPGGGFQAGVIIAAGFILYALSFGMDELLLAVPPQTIRILMSTGVGLYAGTGVVTLLLGGQFLDFATLGSHGQHYGIFTVELGVGISVAAVILSLFYAFVNYRPPLPGAKP